MMKYTHFLLIACCCCSLNLAAQAQYGLVIGINRYYKLVNGQKVLDPENSKLKGCVTDARSIRELLVTRFGFKAANITEIYDFQASEANVRQAIKDLLAKCKPGDVAVVYYSGHGFSFPHIDPQTGTQWAEAICTADFNAIPQGQYNYIQGSELASLFGQFVDKGVTLTALFDCCHSNSTVRLKKNQADLTGIRKVLDMSAWKQAKEFDVDFSHQVKLKETFNIFSVNPLIIAFARDTIVPCDNRNNAVALSDWLNRHGGATGSDDSLTWTYKEIEKFKQGCQTQGIQYEFTASHKSGRTETTRADFLMADYTAPTLLSPARDTTIVCCGNDYAAAFDSWLSRNGGALAWDACSLNWTNDFTEQKRTDLDNTGSTQVLFTASDGCSVVSSKATFMAEDRAITETNRISDLEVSLIVNLLNALPAIKESLAAPKFIQFAGVDQRASQLKLLEVQRDALLFENNSNGMVTKPMIEKLQGTAALGELYGNIKLFVDLTDPLFNYKNNLVADISPVSQPPLDFLVPVTDRTDYSDFLNEAGTGFAKEIVLVTADPKRFPFEAFGHRPPSKIQGSKFLFMSATDDVQRGVEKKDENSQPRGAFTKALISVLRDGPADMSAITVFEKVKQQMSDRYIPHAPSMSVAPGRRNQNLFGVESKVLTQKLSAKCIKINPDKTIILDKGSLSGLSPGNVLRSGDAGNRYEVEVVQVTETQSTARNRSGFQSSNFSVNALMNTGPLNQTFALTDAYMISKPLVKVFIPNDSSTAAQQLANFEKYYKPLLQSDPDLIPFDSASGQCTKIYMRGKNYTIARKGKESLPQPLQKLPAAVNTMNDYFIYLPVQNDIGAAVRGYCLKDQNFELVKSPALSNLSFYCTYSKKQNGLIYVVTDQETTGQKRTNTIHTVPYYFFPATDPKTGKSLTSQQLAGQIYQTMLLFAARYGWINKSLKK